MCGSSTLSVVALLLLLVTSLQGEDEDLCAGKDKDFVCIDTVHYKVCLPPELKRVEGDEPVVRCPDATRCDDRSPWRCSAPSTETVAHVAARRGGSGGVAELPLLQCPAEGAFRGGGDDDDDCRSYLWCGAKGAEGALRSCHGDDSAFDVVLGKCVPAASLTVDPRNAACLPSVSPPPQVVQPEQDQPEQQQQLVEQDRPQHQQLEQAQPQELEQDQEQQLVEDPQQQLEVDKPRPEQVARDQPQQLRSKRGIGSVLDQSTCASGAACSTVTSDPSHLLDLLFEEGDAAPEQRDKRGAAGKEPLLNAPPSRKTRPESGGEVKKQKLERRAEPAEEHKVAKDKEGQQKVSKEPKAPEEKRLQAKVVEEKSVEDNPPELNVDWMDRVRTLLRLVEEDKERWKKMMTERPLKSSYRRWSRVHSDYKDMFEGDALRARRTWRKREGEKGGKEEGEEEKEADEGNHTFLFQERAQKTDEEGNKAAEKRARGGAKGHHKHRHHQQKHKEQRSGGDALEEDEEDKGEGGVDVFKDKDRRGELVHFGPRDKDKKVEKGGGRKDARAVYVVKVSSGNTQAPKLMEAAAKMEKEEDEVTPPAGAGAGTVCYYTCMPSHGGGGEAEKSHSTQAMEEAGTQAPGEATEAQGASSEAAGQEQEARERGSTEAAALGHRTSVKTLDFSGRVKVSEKCDEEKKKPGAEQAAASTPENRSKQLLDINFDQLMEDNARVYHGGCLQAAPPHRERKAGGGGGKLYALPEQYDAHEDLHKKAVSVGKAKAPPEGLAVDVQQQLRGGAVRMPGDVEADEDADEEDDDEGGAGGSVTERDVFRGRRRRGTRKAEGGGGGGDENNHVDVNVTLELSNETFQPPAFNCHGRGGRFPDPSSVHRYYSCAPSMDGSDFQATRLICPAGREFDPALGECVRRHHGGGGDDVLPPASAARPPPPPPCPADRVLDRSTGMCVRADATTPQCPPGTVYDRTTGECRRESSLDLVSRLLPPWPHVTVTSPLQRCVRPGRLANPRDCSSFFLCVPRRRRRDAAAPDGGFMRLLVACPSQSVFDPGSGRCAPGSPRTCQLRLRRCRRPGRFARSDAPADYVLCTPDLTPVHMRCPPGQVFSRALRHCVVITPPPLSSSS